MDWQSIRRLMSLRCWDNYTYSAMLQKIDNVSFVYLEYQCFSGWKKRNSLLLIGYYKRILDINNRIDIITL